MSKVLLFLASLLVGVALLIGVIRFIGWQEIQSAFYFFSGWQGAVIILLTVAALFFGMWKWQIILKNQGYQISNKQLIPSYLAGFSIIYLFPMLLFGGEFFKGYVLREKFNIPLRKGMISILIDKIIEETSFVISVIVGLIIFLFKIDELPPSNTSILIGSFLLVLIALFSYLYFKIFKKQSIAIFFAKLLGRNHSLNGHALEIEKEIFDFFKKRDRAFWAAFGLAFLRIGATWARAWLLVLFLGKQIGALTALSILGFYYLAIIIPIPAALGTHEVIQTFSFSSLSIGAGTAAAFAIISRGAEMVLAVAGLLIFSKLGLGLLGAAFLRKIEKINI
ncbi:MAG: flippase-like domain-containing protein [Candidatus Nealsonbacteria bacterium]|nr:flippase-like domain-containing protein [Candidatus Nealsonbacteria bacterium]